MEDRERIITFGEAWDQKRLEAGIPDMNDADWESAFGKAEDGSSLAVRIFTVIGAWIGALCFIGMLALLGWINSMESSMAWGAIFAVAFALSPFLKNIPVSMEPFLLAIGLIGQAMLFGVLIDKWGVLETCIIGGLIESALLVTTKSPIQRFISTVLLFLTVLGFIQHFGVYEITHVFIGISAFTLTYFWVNEAKILAHDSKAARFMEPVGTGLAFSLVLLLMITVNRDFYEAYIPYWWASSLLIAFGVVYISRHIMHTYHVEQYQWLAYAAIAIALAPTVFAPGIALSLLLILLGFYRGHALISGLGALALIIFVSFFYYNMQASLLIKSISLIASGFVMIMVRMGLARMVAKN